MRVLVSHREPLLAAGVRSVLRSEPDLCVFDDGDRSRPDCADVIVTDYDTGLGLARAPRRGGHGRARACAVVVLTLRCREHDIRRAIEAGVDGYVIQGCKCGEVAHAIRTVSRGERHVSTIVAEQLAQSLAREALSAREHAVLELLAAGRCNKTIARQLLISVATVKGHVSAILDKVQARSRTEAVRVGASRGLVNLTSAAQELAPLHSSTTATTAKRTRAAAYRETREDMGAPSIKLETRMNNVVAADTSQAAGQHNLAASDAVRYELCYRPLFGVGCGFAFPCDARGNVILDGLSERALNNYLYARVVTGSQLGWPSIERRP
jgi:DNA-binding NarL/FixJ family response regulator